MKKLSLLLLVSLYGFPFALSAAECVAAPVQPPKMEQVEKKVAPKADEAVKVDKMQKEDATTLPVKSGHEEMKGSMQEEVTPVVPK